MADEDESGDEANGTGDGEDDEATDAGENSSGSEADDPGAGNDSSDDPEEESDGDEDDETGGDDGGNGDGESTEGNGTGDGSENGSESGNGSREENASGEENGQEDEGSEDEGTEDGQLVASGESHSFEGEGATASEEFSLSDGIATVEFSHDGESNFIVEMLDLEGDEFDDQLLVNVIGSIEGRSVIPVGGSQYQLDIDADGAWSIGLDQPGVGEDKLEQLPLSAEGTGPDFVGPVRLEGVTEVAGSHAGESNFIVETRTAKGGLGSWDIVFNEIGEFEGSGTTRAEGVAWVDINADGDWTLEIGG